MREHFSSRQGTPSLGSLEKDKKTLVAPVQPATRGSKRDSRRRNPNA